MKTNPRGILNLLFFAVALASVISACSFGDQGLKKSIGSVNELLIVTNDKAQWEEQPGDTIRAFFAADQAGLPQPEPMFDLVNVADEDFSGLFQKYHNILIVNIDPGFGTASSETSENSWAKPQRIIKISAPDLPSFYSEFNSKKENYLQIFVALERKRTLTINQISEDLKLSREIEKKFGIYLPVPGGFYKATEAPEFMWIRHVMTKAKQDVELSIMIYSMDYKDQGAFDPRFITQWRDALTKIHIPGPSPVSYMKIAREFMPPVFDTITDFPGGYAVETRGLWEVENDFMGGPFVSYTFVDKATNKVITLDGYVYNPNEEKKALIRQLEAIFFAVQSAKP